MTPDYVRMMAAYSTWMNQRLFSQCGRMSEEERRHDAGAFFRSIHGTLDHLVYGDCAWMARFDGGAPAQGAIGTIAHEGWAELVEVRRSLDSRITAWAESVTGHWLTEPMSYRSVVDGKTRTLPRWVLVAHMFNHGTHHRGQLTTLMKQRGVDPGVTDLPWMPALYEPGALGLGQQK